MTRQDRITRAIADYRKKITRTKSTARAALIEEGIYDKEGELTVEYGGVRR